MRICLVLEGCYPYVHGGVSTWMHGYIQAMPEHEFVLWVIGAHAADRGKFVYELPSNVVEVHEVFLDDALRLSGEQHEASFNDREREALRRLVSLSNPDWDVLFDIFQRRRVHPLSFLQSRTFMDIFRDVCLAEYLYTPFADAFHTMRSMLLPVLYLLGLAQIAVYFVVFTALIKALDLPTPGRRPEEPVRPETAPLDDAGVEKLIAALGGRENICTVDNCFTRLRVTVNDPAFVKEQALKALPCSGVVQSGCDVQIVYGIRAPEVRQAVERRLNRVVC